MLYLASFKSFKCFFCFQSAFLDRNFFTTANAKVATCIINYHYFQFDSGDWWFIVRYYVVIYAIDYGMFQYKRKTDNTQMNVTCSSEPMLFQTKGFKTINILLIFTVKKLLTCSWNV